MTVFLSGHAVKIINIVYIIEEVIALKKNFIPLVAAVHDMSGFGRCSLTVAIPVLSAMGIQCAPLPTAILSNHTAYDSFTFLDLTDEITPFYKKWQDLDLQFNALYTGFLGSEEQVEVVENFIQAFRRNSLVMVDPVMADNGKVYSIYTPAMCAKMTELAFSADIITPNLTEAAILLDRPYGGEDISTEEGLAIAKALSDRGPSCVVLTGLKPDGQRVVNLAYQREGEQLAIAEHPYINCLYHGTGDLFSSVLCGMLVLGRPVAEALQEAAEFTYKTALYTYQVGASGTDGVIIEPFLSQLPHLAAK